MRPICTGKRGAGRRAGGRLAVREDGGRHRAGVDGQNARDRRVLRELPARALVKSLTPRACKVAHRCRGADAARPDREGRATSHVQPPGAAPTSHTAARAPAAPTTPEAGSSPAAPTPPEAGSSPRPAATAPVAGVACDPGAARARRRRHGFPSRSSAWRARAGLTGQARRAARAQAPRKRGGGEHG